MKPVTAPSLFREIPTAIGPSLRVWAITLSPYPAIVPALRIPSRVADVRMASAPA